MREIPRKNYYILALLLIVTVIVTLALSNLYLNKEKEVSQFFEYSNKITRKEFDEFMSENSDVLIYVSDKYDLTNKKLESKIEDKLNDMNLKQKLIYIDKSEINKDFSKKLKKEYKIDIDLNKLPILIVIVDNSVMKNVSLSNSTDIDSLIEYEVFK